MSSITNPWTATTAAAVLNSDASASIHLDFSGSPTPAEASKRSVKQLNRRPMPPKETPKDAIVDEQSKEAFSRLDDSYKEQQMKFINTLQFRIKAGISMSSNQELMNLLHEMDSITDSMKQSLTVNTRACEARHVEAQKRSEIVKDLKSCSYAEVSSAEQEAVDAKLSGVCQAPSLAELRQKYLHFVKLSLRFKQFKVKIEHEKSQITNHQSIMNASTIEGIDFPKLEVSVRELLKTRDALLGEATELKRIIPQAYMQLRHLISKFVEVYTDVKMDPKDIFFVRSAAINYKTVEEEVESYEAMYRQVQLLKGKVVDFQGTWDLITKAWNDTRTDIRKLAFIFKENRIPSISLFSGREWVGKDAYGVTSFDFETIEGSNKSYLSKLTSWFYSPPAESDGSGPSSSNA